MRLAMLSLLLLSLSACADMSLTRERGATVNGYTTYTTTVVITRVDEPACVGTCKP